ncbi:type II toxin-antitoxin system HicB family antitoxin [Halomarina pelagica]|uniref:type II toxin-antitoxin system HicB family antitoxin n=1 Tax=Halomarina pelagica TaxID=2961599 RepID=UPI0020C37B73|nr:hypothetical protein [Halomarina sp. BND7]
MSTETITLTRRDDNDWIAIDEQTGVRARGPTRTQALVNLDEAVARRAASTSAVDPDDPFWSSAGLFSGGEPTDVSTNVDEYLVKAWQADREASDGNT